MKIVPIIITTGAILSGIGLTLFNTFCISEIFGRSQRAKRKKADKKAGPIFVIYQDSFEQSLSEVLIPEISNQCGIKTVTMFDSNVLGKLKTTCYREMIGSSSMILIIVTEELLHDPWLSFAMAFCFQKNINSLGLCYDENISINRFPWHLQNAIRMGCKSVSFNIEKLKNPADLKQLGKEMANFTMHVDQRIFKLPGVNYIENHRGRYWEYDAYFMHGPEDQIPRQLSQCEEPKLCFSSEVLPGKYLYQGYSEAIHSSSLIFILLTPRMIQNSFFEYQLRLALCCKGHRSVVIILNSNCVRLLRNNTTLSYAIATCKKIYIKQDINQPNV